jgi:hypothetical protein
MVKVIFIALALALCVIEQIALWRSARNNDAWLMYGMLMMLQVGIVISCAVGH